MVKEVALGIDLGTTNTCVAYVQNGRPEIIQVDNNDRTTMPSCVSFTPTGVLVGKAAKDKERTNSANTITSVKRLIGRAFDNPEVQAEIERRPYAIREGRGARVHVEIERDGKTETFLPEQISAMILKKAVSKAKERLGNDVVVAGVVVTIPAYFNKQQRKATKDAAEIAGLKVLGIINEPTAAAIAYGLKWATEETRNDWCIAKCETEAGVDIASNPIAFSRLKFECRKAKELLAVADVARIIVPKVAKGVNFDTRISRVQFGNIIEDLVEKTMDLVKRALKGVNPGQRKKMAIAEIHHVVLVGGTTRLPMVQARLRELFKEKELNFNINQDEAVAHGAALQAAMYHKDTYISQEIHLVDVAPLGLGIEVQNRTMDTLVKRNTPIPVKVTRQYTTENDFQEEILFKVLEGMRAESEHDVILGEFLLTGITPLPKRETQIDVTFEVDAEGIYHVSAKNVKTGKVESITIKNGGGLSKDEIKFMIAEAEQYEEADKLHRRRLVEQNKLDDLCGTVQAHIDSGNYDDAKREHVAKKCDELVEWLREHRQEEPEEYVRKHKELGRMWTDLCKQTKLEASEP